MLSKMNQHASVPCAKPEAASAHEAKVQMITQQYLEDVDLQGGDTREDLSVCARAKMFAQQAFHCCVPCF